MSDSGRCALSIGELAELVGATAHAACDLEHRITRVRAIAAADSATLVFAEDAASLHAALASGAGAILTGPAVSEGESDKRVLRVGEPRYAFALAARELRREQAQDDAPRIHPAANVDLTARLGARVQVNAGAVIAAFAVVGDDCSIGSNAVIGEGVVLGDRVVVQAGAVLGSLGFGYVRNAQSGEYLLFPQQGSLVVEDDVEIGANTTIDRGALEETRIGRGTKIDNLVHIGHNCRIGRNVVIAAQAGISGSCVVEDGAILAGQVGISDHCHIGPGVILGGQAGVYRGKSVTGPGEVFAGTPAEPLREQMRSLARLRRLREAR
jgi:UDP-3-O-[3-hydroxymyristoyl] glucosamine N-acyltransferase